MKQRILICEDELEIRELLHLYLEKENFDVTSVPDGYSCVKALLNGDQDFDLVLLDIMMPGMDGYEALRRIRIHSNVPVVFLTACREEEQKIRGLGLGADDYVLKPFSLKELTWRIKAQIRRSQQYADCQRSQLITYGDLSLDKDTKIVMSGSSQCLLNAKEYDILHFFMTNQDRVVTKKQLYETLWQDQCHDGGNAVMVHLSHLREKIEPNPKSPIYIKTIRCIGYRMEGIK